MKASQVSEVVPSPPRQPHIKEEPPFTSTYTATNKNPEFFVRGCDDIFREQADDGGDDDDYESTEVLCDTERMFHPSYSGTSHSEPEFQYSCSGGSRSSSNSNTPLATTTTSLLTSL